MSIPLLDQVFQESRRLTIAGSRLAKKDTRLTTFVDPLRKLAKKAPVFDKIADGIELLNETSDEHLAQALIELNSLIVAVLYTQGDPGVSGEEQEHRYSESDLVYSQAPAKSLLPLKEVLGGSVSGKMGLLNDAVERGVFLDFRILPDVFSALTYASPVLMKLLVEQVLPPFGKAITVELEELISMKGSALDIKLLKLLHQIDPDGSQEFIEAAVEHGSKKMKAAALALRRVSDDLPSELLEQTQAKTKNVRSVAYEKLIDFADSEAVFQAFKSGLEGKDLGISIDKIFSSDNQDLHQLAVEVTQGFMESALESEGEKEAKKAFDKLLIAFSWVGKMKIKSAQDFALIILKEKAKLEKIYDKCLSKSKHYKSKTYIVDQLVTTLVKSPGKKTQKAGLDLIPQISKECLKELFEFSKSELSVKVVFDQFSGFFHKPAGRLEKEKYEILLNAFVESDRLHKWDSRWTELALKHEDVILVAALLKKGKSFDSSVELIQSNYKSFLKLFPVSHPHLLLHVFLGFLEKDSGESILFIIEAFNHFAFGKNKNLDMEIDIGNFCYDLPDEPRAEFKKQLQAANKKIRSRFTNYGIYVS